MVDFVKIVRADVLKNTIGYVLLDTNSLNKCLKLETFRASVSEHLNGQLHVRSTLQRTIEN